MELRALRHLCSNLSQESEGLHAVKTWFKARMNIWHMTKKQKFMRIVRGKQNLICLVAIVMQILQFLEAAF